MDEGEVSSNKRNMRAVQQDVQGRVYAVAFRRKVYRSVEEIQLDLDAWLVHYNNERTHSGKHCYGKTPMQTFVDSIPLARERLFGHDESDGQGA